MKTCRDCGEPKPLGAFYPHPKQGTLSYCKACHNARCVARVRRSPARQAQQYRAKRKWSVANPIAKRIHERRAFVLQHPEAPRELHALERVLVQLSSAAAELLTQPSQ